eukprot:TRINITY_DN3012_c1_g1_i2.p1 TRINITY_DN3012_c1_g1~~TRINITY_DN3012_c1_g1_i2.p1  ORF type:complete len:405 (+),score=59.79 TRINITY_DN3012_c1_g1_i2:233-1447(+)
MCSSKESWEHFLFVPRTPPQRVARAARHMSFLSVRSDEARRSSACHGRMSSRCITSRTGTAVPLPSASAGARRRATAAAGDGLAAAAAVLAGAAGFTGVGAAAAGITASMMVPPVPPPIPLDQARGTVRPSEQGAEEAEQDRGGSGPRDPSSIVQALLPGFDTDTFIWRISMLQLAEYVGALMLGNKFGSPKLCSLYLLGASWGPAIASGGIWRLFFPIMLHANALHIFFNLFFQMRIGFNMEKQFGRKKFVLLYLFCGFLGNLLSVVNDPMKLAVGASTSGFGLLGVWAAEVFLTWELLGGSRSRIFLWFAFMILSCVMMSQLSPSVDFMGHLGGALAGFLFAIIFADMREEHQPPWYAAAKSWARIIAATVIPFGLLKAIALGPDGPIPYCGAIFHPRVLPF